MITETRREALDLLAELCKLAPDIRLGQLMANLGMLGEDQTDRTLWDIDDDQLLAVMRHHRRQLTNRTSDPKLPPIALAGDGNSSGASFDSTTAAGN